METLHPKRPGVGYELLVETLAFPYRVRGVVALFAIPTVQRLSIRVLRYLVFWTIVWVLVYAFAPRLLVSSRAALSTISQMLPGVLIAVFALIVASVYLVGQQAAAAYGNRAVAVLTSDVDAGILMMRALALVVTAVLISGETPDAGHPAAGVTALVSVLLIATASLIVRATNSLAFLLGSYLAPRSFMLRCTRNVYLDLVRGSLAEVDAKTTALGEMLRIGIDRGQQNTVEAATEGLNNLVEMYCQTATLDSRIRDLDGPAGVTHAWMGVQLAAACVAAGETLLFRSSQTEYRHALRFAHRRTFASAADAVVQRPGTCSRQSSLSVTAGSGVLELGSEHVDWLDARGPREKLVCPSEERFGNRAV